MPAASPAPERFWAKVTIPEPPWECWTWNARHHNGYGWFTVKHNNHVGAHRYAYQLLRGEIPEGLVCDHLCRNRGCCNPWHLELTTIGENVRRGKINTKMKNRTHCNNGHEFTAENSYISKKGYRSCKACHTACTNRRRARERELRSTQP